MCLNSCNNKGNHIDNQFPLNDQWKVKTIYGEGSNSINTHQKEGMYGGRVVHVTALSDSPLGPFKDAGIAFIEPEKSAFALDDHVE